MSNNRYTKINPLDLSYILGRNDCSTILIKKGVKVSFIPCFFKKENKDLLEVVGLVFEGELFSPEKYTELANLPSKDLLIGKFLSAINQPMTQLALTLNVAMSKLAGTLESLKNTKS